MRMLPSSGTVAPLFFLFFLLLFHCSASPWHCITTSFPPPPTLHLFLAMLLSHCLLLLSLLLSLSLSPCLQWSGWYQLVSTRYTCMVWYPTNPIANMYWKWVEISIPNINIRPEKAEVGQKGIPSTSTEPRHTTKFNWCQKNQLSSSHQHHMVLNLYIFLARST